MRNEQASQTIMTQSEDHFVMASESQSGGRTLGRTSNGLSLLLPTVLLLLGLLLLYATSSEAYDAFTHLPVLFQWQIVVACSLFAFFYAVTVREFRTEWHEKFAARIAGAAGVAMLIAFSFRMSMQVDKLQNQVAATSNAKSVSEQHGAAVYQVTLKSGQVIELDESNARSAAVRSLPHLAGRSRTGCLVIGAGHGADSRQHASIDPMPFGQSWQWAAAEPTGSDTDATAARHSPDF